MTVSLQPAIVLRGADVAIIGLNPGGVEEGEGHGQFAMATEGKSAYVDEPWKTFLAGQEPLQVQVQALCNLLHVLPHQVLAGNLVPWRSKVWKSLNGKKEAVDFGIGIWTDIFTKLQPKIVVGIGGETERPLMMITGIIKMTRMETGWGKVTASYGSNGKQRLVCLPHLSTFKIMRKSKYKDVLNALFGQ